MDEEMAEAGDGVLSAARLSKPRSFSLHARLRCPAHVSVYIQLGPAIFRARPPSWFVIDGESRLYNRPSKRPSYKAPALTSRDLSG